MRVISQVTEVEPAPATSPETETVEDIIRKLLPTPALPPPQAVPIPSDRDLLIQQLMAAICPPTPAAQERSAAIDLETLGSADGKCRLIRAEGLVARISNDYRPQLPAVGKDIPGSAAPCHVGTARLLGTGNNQTRPVGRAVRRPYSDSEESVNDVWYADEHDTTVQQVSRRKGRLTQTANNSCGEGCAQLDDFKMETETTAQQLLCPPVVAQTRQTDLPRQLCRGRNVLMEDGAVGGIPDKYPRLRTQ